MRPAADAITVAPLVERQSLREQGEMELAIGLDVADQVSGACSS
ncbi:MAG: hypothetical protein WAL38_05385 [Solirubrobacteraceae bacterium]